MKECTKSETKKTRCDVDRFIEESIAKHGDKFSYEKTRETYLNRNEKCSIHCNIHNIDFLVWLATAFLAMRIADNGNKAFRYLLEEIIRKFES